MPRLSELYQLKNYIDTFALGHYARVLDAVDRRSEGSVAFKVMRPEHLDADGDMQWEYRAFGNEADILTRLWHSPNIVKLYDCGFISDREEPPPAGEIPSFPADGWPNRRWARSVVLRPRGVRSRKPFWIRNGS